MLRINEPCLKLSMQPSVTTDSKFVRGPRGAVWKLCAHDKCTWASGMSMQHKMTSVTQMHDSVLVREATAELPF